MFFNLISSAIRGAYNEKFGVLGSYLQDNPKAFVVAAGYTCNIGTEAYNLWLSERRAESFKSRLVDKYGIDANRVVTLWYGPFNPVGDNATSEGRQRNRRVEIAVGTGN